MHVAVCARSTSLTSHSHWVTERAKERIHHDFERLKEEAVRVYQDTVSSIPCYEMYVEYRGRPPMAEHRIAGIAYEVRAAESELLAAIDDAWSRCVVEYPRWLNHFWTQVRFVPPPPPASPQREERDRVMGRSDGRDGRDGRRRRSRRDSVLTEHGRGRNLDYDTDIRYLDT